jgi:hypothetical protein
MKLKVGADRKPDGPDDNQRLQELDDSVKERITGIKVGDT